MLEAAPVERGEIVAGAVIAGLVADDREVEDRPVALLEHGDVGRIGDQPVEVGAQRIGQRPPRLRGEGGDRGAVRPAGLEHGRRPGDAARLEIEQGVDLRRQRIALERRRGRRSGPFPRPR